MQRQRGELVPVAEVIADLPGPVQALRKTSPQARHHFTRFDQVNALVSASEADPELGFMARMMALCWGSWRGWSLPMLLSARAVGRSLTSSASNGRVRTVPMPSWDKTALDDWATAAGIESGPVLRRVDKGGRVGSGPITDQAVFEAVIGYARVDSTWVIP